MLSEGRSETRYGSPRVRESLSGDSKLLVKVSLTCLASSQLERLTAKLHNAGAIPTGDITQRCYGCRPFRSRGAAKRAGVGCANIRAGKHEHGRPLTRMALTLITGCDGIPGRQGLCHQPREKPVLCEKRLSPIER